jgi:hypothetical protein
MLMSPLLEMSLKSPPAPVTIISTYLTFEFLAKAMEFVKPVRDGLAIPTHRQLQWVINSLLIIFTLTFCSYFLLRIKPSTTSAHTLPPTVHKLTVLTIWI